MRKNIETKLISVIVPIYNVESYLKQCIDSILSQQYSNYEVILVDDGSSDNSGKICDNFARKYGHIKVVHQANKGVSVARNTGLARSSGEYVLFVDADDVLCDDALLSFCSVVERYPKVDIVAGGLVKFSDNQLPSNIKTRPCSLIQQIANSSGGEAFSLLLKKSMFEPSSCANLFKRSLFLENGISFKPLARNNEDVDCSLRLYLKAKMIRLLDKPHYLYRQSRNGSASSMFNSSRILDSVLFISEWVKLSDSIRNRDLRKSFRDYVFYQYSITLGSLFLCNKDTISDIYPRLRALKDISKYGLSRKTKLVRILITALGLKITGRILAIWVGRTFHNLDKVG